jgi:hypothetical protein
MICYEILSLYYLLVTGLFKDHQHADFGVPTVDLRLD